MFSRFVTILFGIIIFIGVALVNYLASPDSTNLFSDSVQVFFSKTKLIWYLFLIVVYVIFQFWKLRPKTASKLMVEELRDVVEENYLPIALVEYYDIMLDAGFLKACPVRINVMLRYRKHVFLPSKLKITYQCCENHRELFDVEVTDYTYAGCYADEELECHWKPGMGACGQALKRKEVVFYDSENPKYSTPYESLSTKQKSVISDVHSVLSIPIWHRRQDRVIGVLNIDSKFNIDKTHFDDVSYLDGTSVVGHFKSVAESLAVILSAFVDGYQD